MNTLLRMTLITLTIGGGFTGAAITAQVMTSSASPDLVTALLYVTALLMYLFVLVSGLLFIHNPRCTRPLIVALAIQVPVITSPIVTYYFGAGLFTPVVMYNLGITCWFQIGCQWLFGFLQPRPWQIGCNPAALLLLIALVRWAHRTVHTEPGEIIADV